MLWTNYNKINGCIGSMSLGWLGVGQLIYYYQENNNYYTKDISKFNIMYIL